MKNRFILSLSQVFNTTRISTRERAREAFKLFPGEADEYILDFSEIEFVSRSFADEVLKLKKNLKIENKKVRFENMQDTVKKMFEIAAHQAQNFTKRPLSVAISEITTLDQL